MIRKTFATETKYVGKKGKSVVASMEKAKWRTVFASSKNILNGYETHFQRRTPLYRGGRYPDKRYIESPSLFDSSMQVVEPLQVQQRTGLDPTHNRTSVPRRHGSVAQKNPLRNVFSSHGLNAWSATWCLQMYHFWPKWLSPRRKSFLH